MPDETSRATSPAMTGIRPPPPATSPPSPPVTGKPSATPQAMAEFPQTSPSTSPIDPRIEYEDGAAPHIIVSDPCQRTEGINKYTSYRVEARDPNSAQPCPAVLRRYSDFRWLKGRLNKERPGGIIPPLPEKQATTKRFDPIFVEDRRCHLEQFLRRVVENPELQDAPSLDTFLRADDVVFRAFKNTKKKGDEKVAMNDEAHMAISMSVDTIASSVVAPTGTEGAPKKKKGVKKWFAETKASYNLVRCPDDEVFEDVENYIKTLETQLRTISSKASTLIKRGKEHAHAAFEIGMSFNLLGQVQLSGGVGGLGDLLRKTSDAVDASSVLEVERTEGELQDFDAALDDALQMIHAAKLAVQRRQETRLTYSAAVAAVETKRQALKRLQLSKGMEAKAYGAEMSLRRAEAAEAAAREEHESVSSRVLREVDRFRRQNAEVVRDAVLKYAKLQVEYNEKMDKVWSGLVPELERISLDDGATTSSSFSAAAIAAKSASIEGGGATMQHHHGLMLQQLSTDPHLMPAQQQLHVVDQQQNASGAIITGGELDLTQAMNIKYRDPVPEA